MLPSTIALRYLCRTGIRCLFVASTMERRRPVKVGWDQSTATPTETGTLTYWTRLWCERQSDAERIIERFRREAVLARTRVNGSWFDMSIEAATESLRDRAAAAGVLLTENFVIRQRVGTIEAMVTGILRDLHRTGEIKAINRAYKDFRIARGGRATDYSEFLARKVEDALEAARGLMK